MRYRYTARGLKGGIETGIVEAASESGAVEILQRQGLVITTLEPIKEDTKGVQKEIKLFQKVSSKDLVFLTRQLSILVASNVSIVDALHSIASQTSKDFLRYKIEEIANDVNGGMSLSEAIAKHPDIFSPFFINMVKVGEVGGNLPRVFNYLADHQENEYVLMSRIRGAMLYPALILCACGGVLVLMVTFVLPRVSSMFKQFETQLPPITRVMLGVSDFFSKYFFLLLILFVGIIILFYRYIKTPEGRQKKDRFLLNAPIIGRIFRNMYYARMCENLGTLLKGGIPIVQALDTISMVIGNVLFKEVLEEARDNVRKGEGISPVFEKANEVIDATLTKMVENGEKSGKIDKVLVDLAVFYNGEVERSVENLMTILEPILLIGIGGVVLLVAIGVIVPIYSLVNAIY